MTTLDKYRPTMRLISCIIQTMHFIYLDYMNPLSKTDHAILVGFTILAILFTRIRDPKSTAGVWSIMLNALFLRSTLTTQDMAIILGTDFLLRGHMKGKIAILAGFAPIPIKAIMLMANNLLEIGGFSEETKDLVADQKIRLIDAITCNDLKDEASWIRKVNDIQCKEDSADVRYEIKHKLSECRNYNIILNKSLELDSMLPTHELGYELITRMFILIMAGTSLQYHSGNEPIDDQIEYMRKKIEELTEENMKLKSNSASSSIVRDEVTTIKPSDSISQIPMSAAGALEKINDDYWKFLKDSDGEIKSDITDNSDKQSEGGSTHSYAQTVNSATTPYTQWIESKEGIMVCPIASKFLLRVLKVARDGMEDDLMQHELDSTEKILKDLGGEGVLTPDKTMHDYTEKILKKYWVTEEYKKERDDFQYTWITLEFIRGFLNTARKSARSRHQLRRAISKPASREATRVKRFVKHCMQNNAKSTRGAYKVNTRLAFIDNLLETLMEYQVQHPIETLGGLSDVAAPLGKIVKEEDFYGERKDDIASLKGKLGELSRVYVSLRKRGEWTSEGDVHEPKVP